MTTLETNSQGYGNPGRDYGFAVTFVDLHGKDKYSPNGEDNTWWVTPSMWVAGIDGEFLKVGSR